MTALKNHVTQGDLAHGKQLLLACERGSGRAFEALCEWQREHFGVSDEAWRKTIGQLCLDAGNRDRAVRLFDAMAKPFDENPYHNLTIKIARRIGLALVVFVLLGIAGGVVYLLGAIGRALS